MVRKASRKNMRSRRLRASRSKRSLRRRSRRRSVRSTRRNRTMRRRLRRMRGGDLETAVTEAKKAHEDEGCLHGAMKAVPACVVLTKKLLTAEQAWDDKQRQQQL